MNVVGIVAEYNPFHTGHLYHIEQSRQFAGEPSAVIAVMSGNFVQRGDFAIFNKHARAEAACAAPGGADLVIELPTPFACASAERFAMAAVRLLDDCGVVTHLSFGSEAGEIESLRKVAELIDTEEFSMNIKENLKEGISYPAARQKAVERKLGPVEGLLQKPNNTLGIEYLRALTKLRSSLIPVTIHRKGSDHDSIGDEGDVASASHIRSMIFNGRAYSAMRYIPEGSIEVIIREMSQGTGPIRTGMNDQAILAQLRKLGAEDFERFSDVSEGLNYRIFNTIKNATTTEDAADHIKSKRYTHSRIRRILINAYLGITSKWEAVSPPYIKVLAFNEKGRALLKEMKTKSRIPVIIKPADASDLWGANAEASPQNILIKELFETEALATDLYMLACPSVDYRKSGFDLTKTPAYIP